MRAPPDDFLSEAWIKRCVAEAREKIITELMSRPIRGTHETLDTLYIAPLADSDPKHPGKAPILDRAIRGYITDFVRQTQKQTDDVNYTPGLDPDDLSRKQYRWNDFITPAHAGIAHTKALARECVKAGMNEEEALHTIGKIIGRTVDVVQQWDDTRADEDNEKFVYSSVLRDEATLRRYIRDYIREVPER